MATTDERVPAPEGLERIVQPGRGATEPVLVGLDGSDLAERALPYAARVAYERGAPLIVVRVAELYPHGLAGLTAAAAGGVLLPIEREVAADYLQQRVDLLR
jgi:nucleotide-binding universal stress UspA family protein